MYLNYLADWLAHGRCFIAEAILIIIGNTQKEGDVIGTRGGEKSESLI